MTPSENFDGICEDFNDFQVETDEGFNDIFHHENDDSKNTLRRLFHL